MSLKVVCNSCIAGNDLMQALKGLDIGFGESVLFGFDGAVDENGELTYESGKCENLGSIGFHRADVTDYLIPVDIADIFVPGPGVYRFEVWISVDPRQISIDHNPDKEPVLLQAQLEAMETVLTGLAEEFEDPRNLWDLIG